MSARIPHGWDNPDGSRTDGTLPVVLCATCDAGDPTAGALITFFHVHEYITPDLLHECADLIQRWASNITIPPVDLDALDAETRAWQHGDL